MRVREELMDFVVLVGTMWTVTRAIDEKARGF